MNPEQKIRFELVKTMLQTGVPIGIIFEYTDKLVSLVMVGKTSEQENPGFDSDYIKAGEFLRMPNVKMHTDTGIPVKFE